MLRLPLRLAASLLLLASTLHAAPQPNILLIVSDDQGYNDLGILGNGIITPTLDRLAKEGTRLTNFYVAWPACTPSRASLLTGRYPQRNGIYDMIRNEAPDYGHKYSPEAYDVSFERVGGMDEREVILPAVLQPAGYKCGIYGKWDLGTLKRFLPTSRGFDDFYGFVNTGIDYFTHRRYGVPSMFRNKSPTTEDEGTYCTYLFEREAMRFIDQHAGKAPFFLYLPFNAPHNSSALEPEIRSSVQAPQEFKDMYPAVDPETQINKKYRYGAPATVATQAARRRDYRAAVTCMDASIGKLLDRLQQLQQLDNTIVIFFSDNGGSGGADNAPLRGHKGQTWEGGIRVPCIVRWPDGGVKPMQVNDELLSSLELLPSLAAAAGAEAPDDVVLDGFDWWPTLCNQQPSPRKEMFWKRRDMIGARVGQWKWVDMAGRTGGLFDLEADPGERNNLAESHPEVLQRVQARYANWIAEMEAAEPRGPFRDF
ncbi:Arylsulfatase [Rosistilla carotiformis]|uniref:Arylsulfatase n=1 Tax=Rosistilla carotiformis TaxID=2528017 RepID=A0A518JZ35_9BACT|nr:sulfatase-like hydrolase/transferase [Rosistilla carotiformis]QDV70808.1 Arylsulfatase [Rosistilla carotiformis]